MDTFKSFVSKLYRTVNDQSFTDIALGLFRYQALHNPVYSAFIEKLSIPVPEVRRLDQIPFLPISLFKHYDIKTGEWEAETVFRSSGTTANVSSCHSVPNLALYLAHAQTNFEYFFGNVEGYHFLALLPSYLERTGSSLIAMMDHFIKASKSPYSGFYLHDTEKLLVDIAKTKHENRKTILWGVSFALLEMAETYSVDLSHVLIFETGGMKGRAKEITRARLHDVLAGAFRVNNLHSEYGMTELFSQAYTKGGLQFHAPPWMKVLVRDLTDPLHKGLLNESGAINVIDLANRHSIAFIETEDLGIVYGDGSFEILGRVDNSDLRGCNLLLG